MNYTEKINSLITQSHKVQECASGLCEHPEHKVNMLVWLVPAIAVAYLMTKMYKEYYK